MDAAVFAAIFAFGLALCLWRGRVGFMPLDDSIVFDGAWRVVCGQVPWRDFDLPDGLVPILLQALLFKIVGTTWFSYCLHAALFNGLFGVLAAACLRLLGGGRGTALVYGALSTVVFYPPIGVPYMEQHAFFFSLLALVAALAAARASNGRAAFALAAVVPPALALGVLSKQIPTAFVAPLVLLASCRTRARNRRSAFGGYLMGAAASAAAFAGLAVAAGVPWSILSRDVYEWPRLIGTARMEKIARSDNGLLATMWRCLVDWHSLTAMAVAVVGAIVMGALAARLVAAWRRHEPRQRIVLALLDTAIAWGLLLTCLLFAVLTHHEAHSALAFVFLSLGILHVVLARTSSRSGSDGPERIIARMGAVAGAALIVLSIVDAWRFDRDVNVTRAAIRIAPAALAQTATQAPLPAQLSFLVWALPPINNYPVSDLGALVDYFARHPGRFFLLGDSSIVYALTGRESAGRALWFHPGLTLPQPGSREFRVYQRGMIRELARQDVRYIVFEGPHTWLGASAEMFPLLERRVEEHGCGEQQLGIFRVVELCADAWDGEPEERPAR